ncbi:hypothetical protein LY78DRAFT_725967 [Colletotrichum sublineola]|nr:hypothetical protein LY78DRAFT_725967 [Colletotrichum sublineola]
MLLHSLLEGTLLGLALQIPAVANAQSWELAAALSPSLFLRRAFARVAVLGDYAYIDGGEVSQLDAEGNPIKSYASNGVNSTLSIDLSKSWSASNVTIRELSKESQARSGQAIWKNEATNTLRIWGGHSPNGAPREGPISWRFEADGRGGGKWSKEIPTNPAFFADLRRSEEGAFVSTPDAGFWFGGGATGWTNPNPVPQAVPGMVTYNMTTKSWTNETTTAFSENVITILTRGASFVFGGTNTDKRKTYDDVFVLSLPGFVWTQVIYDATNPRRHHSCAVVGRRQMLSVGGVDGVTGWSRADPWPQGLGLFDMTDWTWKTEYDADAKVYETPSTIQDWYKDFGVNSVVWNSDSVRAVFNPTDPKDKDQSSSVPAAAIVGAFVGAIVGVIMGLALFWFIRRRAQQKGAAVEVASVYLKDDTGSTPQTYYDPLPLVRC